MQLEAPAPEKVPAAQVAQPEGPAYEPAVHGAALAVGETVVLGVVDVEREEVLLAEADALVVVDVDSEGVALAESDALGVVEDDSDGVALAESEELGVVNAESEALALVVALTVLEEDMVATKSQLAEDCAE